MNEKLRFLRILNNFTQNELGKQLGVSRTCIANWEKGIRTPSIFYIMECSKLFNVDPEFFISEFDAQSADSFDLTVLNKNGINMLYEYYLLLTRTKKYKNIS